MIHKTMMERKRIQNLIGQADHYPLTVVSAPMGYGKTASVKLYLEKAKLKTIWMSMLANGDDEIIFWNKLSLAVSPLYPKVSDELKKIGFPDEPNKILQIIDVLKRINDKKTKILVLDGYHVMDKSESSLKLIDQVIRENIPGIHILILSRTKPTFNYSELILKGLCHYIDAKALSMTREEIKDYFKTMEMELSEKELKNIFSYTKGWIAAVYLISIERKNGIPMNKIVGIDQLIQENLFEPLDPFYKNILLKLSLLETFTEEEAQSILGENEIYETIQSIMNQNPFIHFDETSGNYSIDEIFSNFLSKMMADEDIDRKEIYRLAGEYYIRKKDFSKAFAFFGKAGKIESFLEDLKLRTYYDLSEISIEILYELFTHISKASYKSHPVLLLIMAYNFILSGDKSLRRKGQKIKDAILTCYEEGSMEVSEHDALGIIGDIDLLNILLQFNDIAAMTSIVSYTARLEESPIPNLLSKKVVFTLGLPFFIYQYHSHLGKLKDNIELIKQGFPLKNEKNLGLGFEELAIAEYYLETLEEDKAEQYSYSAIQKAKNFNVMGVIICSYFNLMRLHLLKGNIEFAEELFQKAWKLIQEKKPKEAYRISLILDSTMDLFQGYMYACIHKVEKIPQWLIDGENHDDFLLMKGMGFPNIIYGKALMLMQNWSELEKNFQSFQFQYQTYHNILGILNNLIYLSVARSKLYGEEEGAKTLVSALADASKDFIFLTIAENADYILPLLQYIYKYQDTEPFQSIDKTYLQKLINISKRYSQSIEQNEAKINLTKREIEVLRLMEQGFTRNEISETLFISISAVKKHLENIYVKLNVNNKVLAIQKAKENGIL